MPTAGEFNPNDEESWYFGHLSRAETNNILSNEQECGTFLVRDSATLKGDYVLCVREGTKPMHYIINKIEKGEKAEYKIGQNHFESMPALLRHYTTHYLDTTTLLKPISKLDVFNRKDLQVQQGNTNNETSLINDSFKIDYLDDSIRQKDVSQTNLKLPAKARVIKNRTPSLYDKRALRLQIGDLLIVTKADINGQCEGTLLSTNRQGTFPFNYVEFLDQNYFDNEDIVDTS